YRRLEHGMPWRVRGTIVEFRTLYRIHKLSSTLAAAVMCIHEKRRRQNFFYIAGGVRKKAMSVDESRRSVSVPQIERYRDDGRRYVSGYGGLRLGPNHLVMPAEL